MEHATLAKHIGKSLSIGHENHVFSDDFLPGFPGSGSREDTDEANDHQEATEEEAANAKINEANIEKLKALDASMAREVSN